MRENCPRSPRIVTRIVRVTSADDPIPTALAFPSLGREGCSHLVEILLEVRGFEPLTPCLQSRCSPD